MYGRMEAITLLFLCTTSQVHMMDEMERERERGKKRYTTMCHICIVRSIVTQSFIYVLVPPSATKKVLVVARTIPRLFNSTSKLLGMHKEKADWLDRMNVSLCLKKDPTWRMILMQ